MIQPRSREMSSGLAPILATVGVFLSIPSLASQWPLDSFHFWPFRGALSSEYYHRFDVGDPLRSEAAPSPRVLNFFPVPVEEECLSQDKRRRGICMNTYECRIQRGKSHGPCALGFGVCCLFTSSCGEEVHNNLTYVTSPGFPNLIDRPMNCTVSVRKIDRQVSQLRIDFMHFNIGQPNRRTGICDEDIMQIRRGNRTMLNLCGWNSGQHVYVDVVEDLDSRDSDDSEPVTLEFRLPGNLDSRIWEMRVVQLGFEQRAPAGCLQYFRSPNGTIRTMNYLPNGRFLAGQDYLVCVRQAAGMCGISYAPCTPDSFRIGPSPYDDGTEVAGDPAAESPGQSGTNGANDGPGASDDPNAGDDAMAEGSGAGSIRQIGMTSPNTGQSVPFPVFNSSSLSRRRCRDRILIPCDFEEFITPGNDGVGICNLEHCGESLCGPAEVDANGNCRVETWSTPFRIRVAFGPGQDTGTTLEENTGMCLTYEQMLCSE